MPHVQNFFINLATQPLEFFTNELYKEQHVKSRAGEKYREQLEALVKNKFFFLRAPDKEANKVKSI